MRVLYSAAQAERELGIAAATVRSWARRQLIYSYGLDARQHPMYDYEDLMRLRTTRRGRGGITVAVSCALCGAAAHEDAPVPVCWEHAMTVHRFVLKRIADPTTWSPAVQLEPSQRSVVYYVRVGELIKIGTSIQQLKKRFSDLPPDRQLLAVEPGDEVTERMRHGQFATERVAVNREWFNPSPSLWRHIEQLREEHGAPTGETHPLAG